MLQRPAISKDLIVFTYAGDLWRVARSGGDAVRLTNAPGLETGAMFSPDGSTIAFLGQHDGNFDVYTIPSGGGIPRRITHHPGRDEPVAFTPDGRQILFQSTRTSPSRAAKLFLIDLAGGAASEVPLAMAHWGSFSPDGKRLAYTPLAPAMEAWKRYRGGRTSAIWLADLADSSIEKIPRQNSNDYYPLWSGQRVFFLSDRNGPMTLFAYDTKSKQVTEAVRNSGFDYKSASLGPDAIVLDHFDRIEVFDLKSGKVSPVDIRLTGDLPGVRPHFAKAAQFIQSYGLSPTGARAVFEARGEILTVPAEKGDIRNLTNTPASAERMPAWSPDGRKIAWFSDESGEYRLHIGPQNGLGPVEKIDTGLKSYLYHPLWSPDGKKILFRDATTALHVIDLASKQVSRIDGDYYDAIDRDEINPSWSPDSNWVVYSKYLKNRQRTVFVHSLAANESHRISDGMSDARHAAFDRDGRHLYFTASTNTGLSTGWLDMSSLERVTDRSVYVAVLRKEDPSPLAPESDEEKPEAAKDEKAKAEKAAETNKDIAVRIDFDGLSQRILALPIPAKNYTKLLAGKTGVLYLLEAPAVAPADGPTQLILHKFDLKTRKTDQAATGLRDAVLSSNGEKILLAQPGNRFSIASTAAAIKPGEGVLKIEQMEVRVEPAAEWKQIYREVWRIQRDFFYDPGLHGVDLAKFSARYEPFLAGIAHREDLNHLFREMLGELSVGHLYVGGGAMPETRNVGGGLLGADYSVENGRYRFAKVYNGENWNPQLRAPLTQPGVNVQAGEYLLAVNGREVRGSDEVFGYFENTAGKSVALTVGPNANGDGARDVTVVPVASEANLRYMDWIESNRRKVEQLSGGRLGYVHLPNTSVQGYTNFNRYFFAQVGKDGIIVDERFNGGGFVADYIIDHLRRPLLNYFTTRAGTEFSTPMNSIFGPKAMIVNEWAGSGGDAMPWMFRKLKIGPLIGKRTWGGLVGIFGFPQLVDNGSVTAPNLAFYNTEREWEVENHGVAPDIEVEQDPALVRKGQDPQLERAVQVLLEELKKNPPPRHEKPPYPNYHRTAGR